MKIYSVLFLILSPFFLLAQEKLNFDKKFVYCENKWVALPADTAGSHAYGFVYIDPQAGLTLDVGGWFKIDSNGKYLPKPRENSSSMKYRLQRNNTLIALIPEEKLKELGAKVIPDWLAAYKQDENTTNYLYIRGFTFNAWGECKSALPLLEKAYLKEPDFKRLRPELAYTYNCLDRHEDAIKILKVALEKEPTNAYVNKELIYAQVNNKLIDEAMQTYKSFVQKNNAKNYDAENAYNILSGLYKKKDIKAFNQWLIETDIQNDKRFSKLIEEMKSKLK